jgi:hypothetical protein
VPIRAVVLCLAALLSACAPITIIDRAEIEAHRTFEPTFLRGADECVGEIWLSVGHYASRADLRLRIDRSGRAVVQDVEIASDYPQPRPPSAACVQQIQSAIEDWRYLPFTRYGIPSPALIDERVVLIPAEQWQTPRRTFPQVEDIAAVRIKLERRPGIYVCEGDRRPHYDLELRGDGSFVLTEYARGTRDEYPSTVQEGQIDATAFADLLEQFRNADFFSLQPEYAGGWTDNQRQTLTLTVGDQSARVLDYIGETAGMPLVVRDLEEAVDLAAGLAPLRCGPNDFIRQFLH